MSFKKKLLVHYECCDCLIAQMKVNCKTSLTLVPHILVHTHTQLCVSLDAYSI